MTRKRQPQKRCGGSNFDSERPARTAALHRAESELGAPIMKRDAAPWPILRRTGIRLEIRETGGTPVLLCRIAPDPVALFFVEQRFARSSGVVRFVPADRVEHELSILGAAISVGLAREQVVRQGREESRREPFQCFGKLSAGK